jgi:hypothetical protein
MVELLTDKLHSSNDVSSNPSWAQTFFTFLSETPHYIARTLCRVMLLNERLSFFLQKKTQKVYGAKLIF